VQKFSATLLLRPNNLVLILALAPSRAAADVLINSGTIIVNGVSVVGQAQFIRPGDIIQINPTA
jgi:ribosomal protein S4